MSAGAARTSPTVAGDRRRRRRRASSRSRSSCPASLRRAFPEAGRRPAGGTSRFEIDHRREREASRRHQGLHRRRPPCAPHRRNRPVPLPRRLRRLRRHLPREQPGLLGSDLLPDLAARASSSSNPGDFLKDVNVQMGALTVNVAGLPRAPPRHAGRRRVTLRQGDSGTGCTRQPADGEHGHRQRRATPPPSCRWAPTGVCVSTVSGGNHAPSATVRPSAGSRRIRALRPRQQPQPGHDDTSAVRARRPEHGLLEAAVASP